MEIQLVVGGRSQIFRTGSSCLGNIDLLGHPRGEKCQKVVLVVKRQTRQLLLRRKDDKS